MREGGDVRRSVGGDISIAFSIDGYDHCDDHRKNEQPINHFFNEDTTHFHIRNGRRNYGE
jgi:hypothetical protein